MNYKTWVNAKEIYNIWGNEFLTKKECEEFLIRIGRKDAIKDIKQTK